MRNAASTSVILMDDCGVNPLWDANGLHVHTRRFG